MLDIIYTFFLNLTRFAAVFIVVTTWSQICREQGEVVSLPWDLVLSLAALYGDKGVSAAKSAVASIGGKK